MSVHPGDHHMGLRVNFSQVTKHNRLNKGHVAGHNQNPIGFGCPQPGLEPHQGTEAGNHIMDNGFAQKAEVLLWPGHNHDLIAHVFKGP